MVKKSAAAAEIDSSPRFAQIAVDAYTFVPRRSIVTYQQIINRNNKPRTSHCRFAATSHKPFLFSPLRGNKPQATILRPGPIVMGGRVQGIEGLPRLVGMRMQASNNPRQINPQPNFEQPLPPATRSMSSVRALIVPDGRSATTVG